MCWKLNCIQLGGTYQSVIKTHTRKTSHPPTQEKSLSMTVRTGFVGSVSCFNFTAEPGYDCGTDIVLKQSHFLGIWCVTSFKLPNSFMWWSHPLHSLFFFFFAFFFVITAPYDCILNFLIDRAWMCCKEDWGDSGIVDGVATGSYMALLFSSILTTSDNVKC